MGFPAIDAQQSDHSGTVLIVCADPRVVAGTNPPGPSRVQQLVSTVRSQPGRANGLSPHVLAVTCPPMIIGEGGQQGRFITFNAPVLAGASRIIVEAHNGCAGLAYFYKASLDRLFGQGCQAPYFELQRQLLERGIERFAGRVAALSGRALIVEANYVNFGASGSVVDVTNIRAVQITYHAGSAASVPVVGDLQATSSQKPA